MEISKAELSLMESVASLVARSKSPQQIAIDADLDLGYVERVLSLPQFEQIFQNIDPKAYEKWKDQQSDLKAKRQVATMVREDMPEYYKRTRDILLNSRDLKDKERIDGFFTLMKFGRLGDEAIQHETVVLSDDNLDTILEAWDETEIN